MSRSRHRLTRLATVLPLAGLPLGGLPAAALAQEPLTLEAEAPAAQVTLDPITLEGAADDGRGPVAGYRAGTSASATKSAVPLIETPQAVSVIGAEQIRDQGARSVTEATRYTPGIRSETFGNDARNDWYLIRGFPAQEASQFLDDLQLFGSAFATWKVEPFLLERIDVVRGPSSALYGSSNPGGLLNLVSKRPTGRNGGEVQASVDQEGNVFTGVDVEGTSADGLWSYRAVGAGRTGGTEVDHIDDDRLALMPTLAYRPDERTALEVYASLQRYQTNGQNFLPYVGTEVAAPFGRIDRDLFTSDPSVDSFDRTEMMAGYRFEHALTDAITVRQNLRYARLDVDFNTLYGGGYATAPTATSADLARYAFVTQPEADLFTVDNQVEWTGATGPLSHAILLGLDYKRYKLDDEQGFAFGPNLDLLDPVYGTAVLPSSRYKDDRTVLDQVGLYAQDRITYENWNLVLSGRWDHVERDVDDALTGLSTSTSDSAFSGRAGLLYRFDNGLSPYVSVARSFLPVVGSDTVTNVPFDPETGVQFEAGLKFQPEAWGDSFFSVAAFDLTRQNVATTDAAFVTRQIGEVRARGLEFEAVGAITPALKVVGAFTIFDQEITEGADFEIGKRPTAVPESFGSLWLDYTFREGTFAGLGFGGGVRYVGSSYADRANTLKVDGAVLLDAAVHYERDNLRVALNVNNLTDETYVSGCSDANSCFYGEGRQVILSLGYTW